MRKGIIETLFRAIIKSFFDLPVKNEEEACEKIIIAMSKNNQ